jgi:hypothetical protein
MALGDIGWDSPWGPELGVPWKQRLGYSLRTLVEVFFGKQRFGRYMDWEDNGPSWRPLIFTGTSTLVILGKHDRKGRYSSVSYGAWC